MGLRVGASGSPKFVGGSRGPPGSHALNALGHCKGHGFLGGGRLSPVVGLRCPQSPGLWRQTPGEGSPLPAADLRLWLGPRSPTGPICWLYGELCG